MHCALCPSDYSSKKFCHREKVWMIAGISGSKQGWALILLYNHRVLASGLLLIA